MGTAAYWKDGPLNLLSPFSDIRKMPSSRVICLKCLQPPTHFVTLSARDMHWPEVIMCLKSRSYEEACAFPNATELVRSDSYKSHGCNTS